MIHIKIYEDFEADFEKREKEITQIKKLDSYLISFFNELGFDNENYLNSTNYETEFRKNDKYYFTIILKYILERKIVFKKSLAHKNDMVNFIPEYFKSIKGLKFNRHVTSYEVDFLIQDKIDNIINQISKEDFLFKFEANKYNI